MFAVKIKEEVANKCGFAYRRGTGKTLGSNIMFIKLVVYNWRK